MKKKKGSPKASYDKRARDPRPTSTRIPPGTPRRLDLEPEYDSILGDRASQRRFGWKRAKKTKTQIWKRPMKEREGGETAGRVLAPAYLRIKSSRIDDDLPQGLNNCREMGSAF